MWGDLMAMGMVFPIAITAGFFLGRWLGGLLGHRGVGIGVGLVWGAATGFWELYKVTVRLNRMDGGGKDQSASRIHKVDTEKGDGHD